MEKEYLFNMNNKYIIFIDGIDEVDYNVADKIINEVIVLEELWKNCCYVLASRPMSLINGNEVKYLPVLSDTEIIEIIKYISGIDYSSIIEYSVNREIKDALQIPFFCILFSLYIKDNNEKFNFNGANIFSRNELIDYLLNKSIMKLSKRKKEIYKQLIKLSIIFIDNKLGKIHLSELENVFDIDELLKSGFVYKSNDEYIYFPLIIIAQWLSAEGIRVGYKDIDEIIKSESQIIKWRYSLSILFGKLTYNESKIIFGKIVSKYPAVASIIIRDGITTSRQNNLPSAYECGEMLQQCMKNWIAGLGDLAYVIAPFRNGKMANLGVDVDEMSLCISWNMNSCNEEIKVFEFKKLLNWGGNTSSHVPIAQSIWPWVDTLNYLSNNLKKLIKKRPLMLDRGILLDEYIWKSSCELMNKGSLYDDSISISEIEKYRKYSNMTNFQIGTNIIDMNYLFKKIDRLIDRGYTFIKPPWPKHDVSRNKKTYFVWQLYSNQRILEKTIFIYENAINQYIEIVEKWFPLIKENLSLYNLLPAKLIGFIHISRRNEYSGHPTLDWYFEPLPKEEKSYVKFVLEDDEIEHNFTKEDYSNVWQELKAKRGEKSEWIHYKSGGRILNIFGQDLATKLVFEWLESDLKSIGWIK